MDLENKEKIPQMLDAKALLELLPISRSSVYALFRDPTFPTIRLGRRIVVPRAELLQWLEQNLHRDDVPAFANEKGIADGCDEVN